MKSEKTASERPAVQAYLEALRGLCALASPQQLAQLYAIAQRIVLHR